MIVLFVHPGVDDIPRGRRRWDRPAFNNGTAAAAARINHEQ